MINFEDVFKYYAPDDVQRVKYQAIREAAKRFTEVILINTPVCSDQSAAIRKIREAVMTANASVALDGRI